MKKNHPLKAGFAGGIILFLIGSCVIPIPAEDTQKASPPTTKESWLYVGGSGPGNYSKIQDAIDNATNGDTVFVYHGTYHEMLEIQQSITLLGENVNLTIIDIDHSNPQGGIVMHVVNAPNVTIDGFCFRNHFSINITGGIWAENCPGLTIRNISDDWHHAVDFGFRLISSDHSTITRTILYFKTESAIDIQHSSNVTISENFILGSIGYLVYSCGISLTDCEEILISNNTITKCILHGISLLNSDKNTLVGNNVQYNNASGMYLLYSNNNLISNNDIAFNNIKGIFVEDSQRNIISKNNINDNGEQYVFFSDAFFNTWNQNYWGSGSRFKYIVGLVHFEIFNLMVPIVKVDWHQATHPYNFGGG